MKRLLLIAIPILSLAVVVSLISIARVGSSADDYMQEAREWQRTTLARTVTAVQAVKFSDTMVVGRVENDAEAAAQNARCADITKTAQSVTQLSPPTYGTRTFGFTSNTYKVARDASQALIKKVDDYQKSVAQPLKEVTTYCDVYTDIIALSKERQAAVAAFDATKDPVGEVSATADTSVVCGDEAGCVPANKDRLPAYEAAYTKAYVDLEVRAELLKGSDPCRLTDLHKLCELSDKGAPQLKAANQKYIDTVMKAASTIDNSDIDAASDEVTRLQDRLSSEYKALYTQLFPDVDTKNGDYETANEIRLLQKYEAQLAAATLT